MDKTQEEKEKKLKDKELETERLKGNAGMESNSYPEDEYQN